MIGRLNHVAIAVPDLDAAIALYANTLGAEVGPPQDEPDHGVTVVFIELPNTKIELLYPLGEDSPIRGFLDKNPSGGIHHICYEVDDIEAARDRLGDNSRAAKALDKAISYFGNHLERMDYWLYKTMGLPIGSGVTEAACKSVVKERLCGSGMKWSKTGAAEVLSLRTLVKSKGRWEEFWNKTARFGFSKITTPKRG